MEQTPLVSAILPVYNGAAFLRDAIDSVLAQSYQPVECIVVDDGSTDESPAIAAEYGARVRLVQQPNLRVAAARNNGAVAAQGELLAFLDADDVWDRDRLLRQWRALEGRPEMGAAVCATQMVDRDLRPTRVVEQPPDLTLEDMLLWRADVVSTSSNLLIRRSLFEEVGGFDTELTASEDWMMTFALVARGELIAIPEPLVLYRVHGSNWSLSVEAIEGGMTGALGKVFDEYRDDPRVMRLRRRSYANLHRMLAGSYFTRRQPGRFLKQAALSVARDPRTLGYFLRMPLRRMRQR